MEKLKFILNSANYENKPNLAIIVGVVNSGNLEIKVTGSGNVDSAIFMINTKISGFSGIWQAVVTDFALKNSLGGLTFEINDGGATPAVVALRLRQSLEVYLHGFAPKKQGNYVELSPQQRIASLLDENTFKEITLSSANQFSPHLVTLGLVPSFADGVIIGDGLLFDMPVVIAASIGEFMGGAIGEISGAKICGLILRGIKQKVKAIVLLIDSGGVRLQEANAGEIAISEIITSITLAKNARIPVIAVVAGKNGAFGGMGIIAAYADFLFISEQGRTGVSGPEVIETVMGVDEYDSRDRALVWRTCGGRHRVLMGLALYIEPNISCLQKAILDAIKTYQVSSLSRLQQENSHLTENLIKFTECNDGYDIWQAIGFVNIKNIPDIPDTEFIQLLLEKR